MGNRSRHNDELYCYSTFNKMSRSNIDDPAVDTVTRIVYAVPAVPPAQRKVTAFAAATDSPRIVIAVELTSFDVSVRSVVVCSATVGVPVNVSESTNKSANDIRTCNVSPEDLRCTCFARIVIIRRLLNNPVDRQSRNA